MIIFYLFTLVWFCVYKYAISLDTGYYEMCGYGEFTWLNELPLYPCNVVILLLPLAVATMNGALLSFVSFTAVFGPLSALLMPGTGLSGDSLFIPRIFGFYTTHFIALMACPLLASLGIYRPKIKDVLKSAGMLVLVCAAVTILNGIMRKTGINPAANYFYSWDPEGNFILELFHSWVPVPFFFSLFTLIFIIPCYYLVALGFKVGEVLHLKLQKRR